MNFPDYDISVNQMSLIEDLNDDTTYPRSQYALDSEQDRSYQHEVPLNQKAPFEAIEQQESSPLLKGENPGRKGGKWSSLWMLWLGTFLVITLGVLLHSFLFQHPPTSLSTTINDFDYIIVGGGPAGILVATKLAEAFPNLQLVLIESGTASQAAVLNDKNLNFMDIPLFWSGVASARDRQQALPMPFASGHHWPIEKTLLGRGLGGSGLHNAMINVRALRQDIESWNMSEWNWESFSEEYIQLEDFEVENGKVKGRGSEGPIATAYPTREVVDAITPLFLQAANRTGWPILSEGFNSGEERLGVGYYEFNIKYGIRDSVAQALLGRRKPPANLVIRTGMTVTRVLLRSGPLGLRAVGVEFLTEMGNVQKYLLTDTTHAEVILSSGAIMTPQILVNSGIGPNGKMLDLPGVGKNLQDHPVVGVSFSIQPELAMEATSIYTIGDELEDYLVAVQELTNIGANASKLSEDDKLFLFEKLGTLGSAGFSAGGFLRSPWATDGTPDIQLTLFPRLTEPHILRYANHMELKRLRASTMLVTVALLKPDARYQVHASESGTKNSLGVDRLYHDSEQATYDVLRQSENTIERLSLEGFRLPAIDLPVERKEYLSSRDIQRLAWGMEQVRRIQATAPLSLHTSTESYPGAHVTGENLLRHVHENHLPNAHWVGSTKMGSSDDSNAVVDGHLRVHGVGGLRIVDGGIIPFVPSGNTHSTICAVASRAAKLIQQDRGRTR